MVLVIVMASLALAAGCSSSKSLRGTIDTASTSSTTVADSTTTAPPVTDAPTTVAETTTSPPTTAAPTPAGWTFIDTATAQGPLAFPCCASNWFGVASPQLPAPGAALADGSYRIEFEWPTDFSQPVSATVTRFELCNVLPAGSCEDNGGAPYPGDDLGVDATTSFALPLVFDDHLHVLLGGFVGNEAPNFATANGLDIAALVTALDTDYQAEILQPYLNGATQDQITAALTAAPANGFSAPAEPFAGALVYTRDGAPPLLFQALVNFEAPNDTRGSDIIGRIALVVSGGQMTINLYAGFYS